MNSHTHTHARTHTLPFFSLSYRLPFSFSLFLSVSLLSFKSTPLFQIYSSLSFSPSSSLPLPLLSLFLTPHFLSGPSVLTEEQARLAVASRGIPRSGLGDFSDDYFIATLLDSITNAASGSGLRSEDRVKVRTQNAYFGKNCVTIMYFGV